MMVNFHQLACALTVISLNLLATKYFCRIFSGYLENFGKLSALPNLKIRLRILDSAKVRPITRKYYARSLTAASLSCRTLPVDGSRNKFWFVSSGFYSWLSLCWLLYIFRRGSKGVCHKFVYFVKKIIKAVKLNRGYCLPGGYGACFLLCLLVDVAEVHANVGQIIVADELDHQVRCSIERKYVSVASIWSSPLISEQFSHVVKVDCAVPLFYYILHRANSVKKW